MVILTTVTPETVKVMKILDSIHSIITPVLGGKQIQGQALMIKLMLQILWNSPFKKEKNDQKDSGSYSGPE